MKYLVVECNELCDGYECDANRTPRFITDDWKNHTYDYDFEVYEILENGEIGKKIKSYDNYLETGMALYYWSEDEDCEEVSPTVIYKYPNTTNKNKVPEEVKKYIKKGNDVYDNLISSGDITFYIDGKYYVYGKYSDNHYSFGY